MISCSLVALYVVEGIVVRQFVDESASVFSSASFTMSYLQSRKICASVRYTLATLHRVGRKQRTAAASAAIGAGPGGGHRRRAAAPAGGAACRRPQVNLHHKMTKNVI